MQSLVYEEHMHIRRSITGGKHGEVREVSIEGRVLIITGSVVRNWVPASNPECSTYC